MGCTPRPVPLRCSRLRCATPRRGRPNFRTWPVTAKQHHVVSRGKCSYEENSQLAQALIFLRAYSSTTRLVTFTIGGVAVTRWLTAPDPVTCAQAAVRTLAANLGQLLSNGHAAAPGATIVVTDNDDPFLAR